MTVQKLQPLYRELQLAIEDENDDDRYANAWHALHSGIMELLGCDSRIACRIMNTERLEQGSSPRVRGGLALPVLERLKTR
jgi:hypothetical protein